jgi:hypothetical protein
VPAQVHFGLGATSVVERVEVRFLSGRTSVVERPVLDQVLVIEEPQ